MYDLIIYDTSNYVDFPIGGQLTSVSNFLTYIAEFQKGYYKRILLVGVTTESYNLGKIRYVEIKGKKFAYLPVVYRDSNLKEVKNSLRIEYLKGLFKYRKLIFAQKNGLHYIHTPEAFIQIKICHPFAKTAVFSHGSFFNMVEGFRFFKKNKIVGFCFENFIRWMLKATNLVFVLDDDSLNQYKKYNKNVIKVNNSVILPEENYLNKKKHTPLRLLFVGRLSRIKGVDEIIKAVESEENIELTIVGDGEERDYLESLVKTSKISFRGALKPEQVKNEMIDSDILVMNSILEGKPMTIIEAMSYGMPIITTNVGGISELVRFGENAEKTDGTSQSIITAMKKIQLNYEGYSQKSVRISSEFDYKKVNLIIFDRIKKLC